MYVKRKNVKKIIDIYQYIFDDAVTDVKNENYNDGFMELKTNYYGSIYLSNWVLSSDKITPKDLLYIILEKVEEIIDES